MQMVCEKFKRRKWLCTNVWFLPSRVIRIPEKFGMWNLKFWGLIFTKIRESCQCGIRNLKLTRITLHGAMKAFFFVSPWGTFFPLNDYTSTLAATLSTIKDSRKKLYSQNSHHFLNVNVKWRFPCLSRRCCSSFPLANHAGHISAPQRNGSPICNCVQSKSPGNWIPYSRLAYLIFDKKNAWGRHYLSKQLYL